MCAGPSPRCSSAPLADVSLCVHVTTQKIEQLRPALLHKRWCKRLAARSKLAWRAQEYIEVAHKCGVGAESVTAKRGRGQSRHAALGRAALRQIFRGPRGFGDVLHGSNAVQGVKRCTRRDLCLLRAARLGTPLEQLYQLDEHAAP